MNIKHSYSLSVEKNLALDKVTYTLSDFSVEIMSVTINAETLIKLEDEIGGAGTALLMAFEPAFILHPEARKLLIQVIKTNQSSANAIVISSKETTLGDLAEKAQDAATAMQNVANSVPSTLASLVKKHDKPLSKLTNQKVVKPAELTQQEWKTTTDKFASGGPITSKGFQYWYDKYGNIQASPAKKTGKSGIKKIPASIDPWYSQSLKPMSDPFGTDSGNAHPSVQSLPGIHLKAKHPVTGQILSVYDIIISLNDGHDWPREKIADWIETTLPLEEITFKGDKNE